jgi:hypothetical protein
MEPPDGFPDAPVPAAVARLPDLHPADAIPPAPRVSDASADVRPDEAAGVALLALAAVRYAEKLAVPALVVPEPAVKPYSVRKLPEPAAALYTPDADRSAA